jgi:hypothetical protein
MGRSTPSAAPNVLRDTRKAEQKQNEYVWFI